MINPLFIALEGIDGSGKSTQTKLLAEKLTQLGHKVYTTFEPTDSPIGKIIRQIFSRKMEASHEVIAALFVADRLHHVQNSANGILKKLSEGYTVITDRYYFSSYAYHGAHVEMNWVIEGNRKTAELLRPDINIYIDVSPEESMKRLTQNRADLEIFETLENQQKVQQKYFEAFELLKNSEKIEHVNGEQSPEYIAKAIFEIVTKINKEPLV